MTQYIRELVDNTKNGRGCSPKPNVDKGIASGCVEKPLSQLLELFANELSNFGARELFLDRMQSVAPPRLALILPDSIFRDGFCP